MHLKEGCHRLLTQLAAWGLLTDVFIDENLPFLPSQGKRWSWGTSEAEEARVPEVGAEAEGRGAITAVVRMDVGVLISMLAISDNADEISYARSCVLYGGFHCFHEKFSRGPVLAAL